ncbi:MAG TPA: class I SAM-dependent methyltransferase [Phycisphaerae bacterium]|nr:class I SAM-dependent methyltransferase [Phycisphaerae bacterium]
MAIHESYYTKQFQAVTDFYKESEAPSQVAFIERAIPLKREDKILDLACGYGRHAIILADEGYSVVGYDQSPDYVEQANEAAGNANLDVTFELADMRRLDFTDQFDVVLSMSSSLAFYADDVNADIIRRMWRALKPGGSFFFDQANVFWAAQFFGAGRHKGSKKLDDGRVHHYETTFDPASCVLSRRSVLEHQNARTESGWDLRFYTLPELRAIMHRIGFTLAGAHGDYDGSSYASQSMRLITIWQKTEEQS